MVLKTLREKVTAAIPDAEALLARLSLAEKIGQLVQINGEDARVSDDLAQRVSEGRVGSIINEVDGETIRHLQQLASDSPHGIPLLIGRDVIHGFKTVMPIPLGQAATFNPELVLKGAEISALEASRQGVNWTFSPMLDVSRDPRWGRIAESFGEDPVLTGRMGAAMVKGYQDNALAPILSCAKHFVGYGASESGRDYNTTSIPEIELRNVHLPPFEAAVDAGVLSVMPSFSDLNGMPPSGNTWLMQDVLRGEWKFGGFVVSDWESISQLQVHGVAANRRDAAMQGLRAGVNMDMVSDVYADFIEDLVEQDEIDIVLIDKLVLPILACKMALGLFDAAKDEARHEDTDALAVAQQLAAESLVLLKNEDDCLPLTSGSVAVIGPLADDPYEQMGTWVFDGDPDLSVTPLQALKVLAADEITLSFAPGLSCSRGREEDLIDEAVGVAEQADKIVLVLGEEAILSGEAHCRSDIRLPGAQETLIKRIAALGKPVILVVMAGRPLALQEVIDDVDALLYAWHPGSMAGPALADVLLGRAVPSGKLPVTLPRTLGQVPIYYNHKRTGKPPTPETVVSIDDIDARAPQLSVGNTSFHLDVDPSPLYPFGFGLSYTSFTYDEISSPVETVAAGSSVEISALVSNTGSVAGAEVVQLYMCDLVASLSRPVKELKGFQRVTLQPGETRTVTFVLEASELGFYKGPEKVVEAGVFRFWVGGSSDAAEFVDIELVSS